jgi:hypothetical protein
MDLIENNSTITKKDILAFLHRYSLKNLWLVGVCAVIIISFGFNISNGQVSYSNFMYLIAGVLIIAIYYVGLFITLSKQTKNFKTISNNYTFQDSFIEVAGETGGIKEQFHIKYQSLFKVKETKKSLYLFVNNASALIIHKNKDNFTKGDAEKLKKLLEMKITPIQNKMKISHKTK